MAAEKYLPSPTLPSDAMTTDTQFWLPSRGWYRLVVEPLQPMAGSKTTNGAIWDM